MRPNDERKLERVEAPGRLVADTGLGLAQISLAWTLEHPGVSSVLLGPRTPEQLTQLVEADGVVLPGDLVHAIEVIVGRGVNVVPRYAG